VAKVDLLRLMSIGQVLSVRNSGPWVDGLLETSDSVHELLCGCSGFWRYGFAIYHLGYLVEAPVAFEAGDCGCGSSVGDVLGDHEVGFGKGGNLGQVADDNHLMPIGE
jgi:hypothetical protein